MWTWTPSGCAARGADLLIVDEPEAAMTIAGGRNVGARSSTADILFHTDADVTFSGLDGLLDALALVFSDPDVVAATTNIWPRADELRLRDVPWNAAARMSVPAGAWLAKGECLIVRRSACEAVGGFDSRIVVAEDCHLFHRLSRMGRVAFVPGHHLRHSTRRFRALGYPAVLAAYVEEAGSLLIRGTSRRSEWEPVR